MINRELKQELDQLSKEVFSSSSKWRKFVENGEMVPLTEETKVADEKGNITGVKQTQVLHEGKNGGQAPKFAIIRYTPETIKNKMIEIKNQRIQLMAMIKKQQEDQATKKALETVSKASGSASV